MMPMNSKQVEREWKSASRKILRAADKIGIALVNLSSQLPDSVAAQVAMAHLGMELAQREPTLTEWMGLHSPEIMAGRPLARFLEGRRLKAACRRKPRK